MSDRTRDLYPPDWPACPVCGAPAMDGHMTCGGVACRESEQRARLEHGMITHADVEAALDWLQSRTAHRRPAPDGEAPHA